MAHDVRSPHIFQDGPGNTASGEAVMDNFDALWTAYDVQVPLSKLVPRILYGAVNGSTGAALQAGSAGWTSTKDASGVYTVTFSPVFSVVPVVTLGLMSTIAAAIQINTISASAVNIFTKDAPVGNVLDCSFQFMAIGAR